MSNYDFFGFPYDWRFGVSDNAVNALKARIRLICEQTKSPRVHVIAHSTGGLIVKKYVQQNEDHKIDKAIFVAVPNLGAPKAISVLLTGNTGISLLNNDEMKKLARNMSIVYDLSPSSRYTDVKGSFYRILTSGFLSSKRQDLGYEEAKNYLTLGRANPRDNVNATAYDNASTLHSRSFDNYDLRSQGIKLFNIVGCKCWTIDKMVELRKEGSIFYSYSIINSPGDETVPLESATNLPVDADRRFFTLKGKHGELPSEEGVRKQIVKIITNDASISPGNSITNDISKCKLKGRAYAVFSPVDIEIVDQLGNTAGKATNGNYINSIPGVSYEVLGDHKFVFLPNDEGQTYTVRLKGTGSGTFTLKVEEISNNEAVKADIFPNIPVSPSLGGRLLNQGTQTILELDNNGDGNVDQSILPSVVLSQDQLRSRNATTSGSSILPPPQAQPTPGVYREPQVVSLSAQEWDMVYYTIDGTTPSCNSGLLYKLPISINSSTTIKAVACLAEGTRSATVSFNYTIAKASSTLINEFRFSGPGGSDDWFVELYNNTDAQLSTNGRQIGFIDANGNTAFSANLTANMTIPPRGYYLVAGPNYSLAGLATPDQVAPALPLNGLAGVGVFNGPVNNAANRLDSAAFSTIVSNAVFGYFREGAGLPPIGNAVIEHSFMRKQTNGAPQDTNNNLNDFILLSPAGGVINGAQAVLGVPGPQSSTSPIERNATMPSLMLNPNVSASSPPNRERNTTPVPNGALGTLAIRRKFTNNTGAPIKKLRFRVIDITNKPSGSEAELRVLGSVDVMINGQPVRGTTLEQPPAQPNGGGMNSTLAVGVITLSNPLPSGASVNVQFLLGVQRGGGFRFFVNVEALN